LEETQARILQPRRKLLDPAPCHDHFVFQAPLQEWCLIWTADWCQRHRQLVLTISHRIVILLFVM
jgi:hypothetical protein